MPELRRYTLLQYGDTVRTDGAPMLDVRSGPMLELKGDYGAEIETVAIPDLVEWLRQRIAEWDDRCRLLAEDDQHDAAARAAARSRAYQSVLDKLEGS